MPIRLRAFFTSFLGSIVATQLSVGAKEGIFSAAKIIYETANEQPDEQKFENCPRVRELLDKTVSDFGSSDLAVRILLQYTIEGLDVAELDQILRDNFATQAFMGVASPEQTEEIPEAPDETVSGVNLPSEDTTLSNTCPSSELLGQLVA